MRVRFFYFLLFLLANSSLNAQDQSLNGTWNLEQIILEDSTIMPDPGRFYLVVENKNILFNLEKNKCGMTAKIQNNRISDCRGGCTKVCCDDWYGTTSKYFDVNGTYIIEKDLLKLTNRWGVLVYSKKESNLD